MKASSPPLKPQYVGVVGMDWDVSVGTAQVHPCHKCSRPFSLYELSPLLNQSILEGAQGWTDAVIHAEPGGGRQIQY